MGLELRTGYKQTEIGVIPDDWKVIDLSHLCTLQRGFDITEATRANGTVPVYSSSGLSYYHNKALVSPPGVVTGRKGILGKVFVINEPFWPHDTTLWVKDFQGNVPAYVALVLENFHLEKLDAATSVPTLNRNNLAGYLIAIPPTKAEQEAISEALRNFDSLIESQEELLTKKCHLKQAAMQDLLAGKKRLPGFFGEWRRATLGQIISRFSTGLNPRENFKLNDGGNIFYVTIKSISKGRLHLDERCDLINEAARQKINERSDLKKGDILFSSIGRVGDAYLIPETPNTWNINESVFVLRPDQTQVAPLMLFYLLTSKEVKDALEQGVTGSTFQSIKQAQLKAISCRLPVSPLEQIAIAEILSYMDAEIAELETQLTKTRALKQGMMHKLLTGEVRLI